MVAQVRVHENHVRAARRAQAVEVGGAEAELGGARREEQPPGREHRLERADDGLRPVGRGVVDDDDLAVEAASAAAAGGRKGVRGDRKRREEEIERVWEEG